MTVAMLLHEWQFNRDFSEICQDSMSDRLTTGAAL